MNLKNGFAESGPTPELSEVDKAIQNARDEYNHCVQIHRNMDREEIDKILEDNRVDPTEEAKKAGEKGLVTKTIQFLERTKLDENMKLRILGNAYWQHAEKVEQGSILTRTHDQRHNLVIEQEHRIESIKSAITLKLGADLLLMENS